jgi:hypothetical protein
METYHVYPTNDLAPHDTESEDCPCHPLVKYVEGGKLVIHNSWDGREELEEIEASA